MEGKNHTLRAVLFYARPALLLLLLFLVENCLLPFRAWEGATSCLTLPAVLAIALGCGPDAGALFALFAGILGMCGSAWSSPVLPLFYTFGAVFVSAFSEKIDKKGKWAFFAALGIAASLLSALIEALFYLYATRDFSAALPFFSAGALLDLIAFFPVFFLTLLLKGKAKR